MLDLLDYCYFGARRLRAAGCVNFHDTVTILKAWPFGSTM